jgi:hypothetical protein
MRACRAVFVGVFLDRETLLGDLFNFNSGLALAVRAATRHLEERQEAASAIYDFSVRAIESFQ